MLTVDQKPSTDGIRNRVVADHQYAVEAYDTLRQELDTCYAALRSARDRLAAWRENVSDLVEIVGPQP